MSYEDILALIHHIDHYHGREFKDRSRASLDSEVRFIMQFMKARKKRKERNV